MQTLDPKKTLAKRQLKAEVLALKRLRILEEASHLFFQNGYEGTTLDVLAERLHVTKPFLYSYYRNKSEILSAICETGIRESLAALASVVDQPGSRTEQLSQAVSRVARIIMERQEYVVVYQREMKNLDRSDAQRILRMRHDFDQRMAQLIAAGVSEGEFHVSDPAITSVWIGGLVSWIANWYSPVGRRSADEILAEIVAVTKRIVDAR